MVNFREAGKRSRKFFETKREAETFVHQKNVALMNQGKEAAEFPSWLRIMAQRENERLQPHGKTLESGGVKIG